LGRLGESFNKTTETLGRLNKEQKKHRKELEQEKNETEIKAQKLKKSEIATLNILEDVEEARKKLTESNRLKDLFMDIMRHDLLNPAGVVRTNTQLALVDEKDVKQKEVLETIERNSNRMITMIQNASIIAKLESGEKIDFKEEDLGCYFY